MDDCILSWESLSGVSLLDASTYLLRYEGAILFEIFAIVLSDVTLYQTLISILEITLLLSAYFLI